MHMLVDYHDVTHVMLTPTSNRATVCEGIKNWRQDEILGRYVTCLWCVVSKTRQSHGFWR